MKVKCTFKKMETSSELSQYAQSRLEKLGKFEMKPVEIAHLVFKAQNRGECEVELTLSGPQIAVQATARADNFFQAVDKASERASKQMARKKDKVQYHKSPDQSREGELAHMDESLDHKPRRKRSA